MVYDDLVIGTFRSRPRPTRAESRDEHIVHPLGCALRIAIFLSSYEVKREPEGATREGYPAGEISDSFLLPSLCAQVEAFKTVKEANAKAVEYSAAIQRNEAHEQSRQAVAEIDLVEKIHRDFGEDAPLKQAEGIHVKSVSKALKGAPLTRSMPSLKTAH